MNIMVKARVSSKLSAEKYFWVMFSFFPPLNIKLHNSTNLFPSNVVIPQMNKTFLEHFLPKGGSPGTFLLQVPLPVSDFHPILCLLKPGQRPMKHCYSHWDERHRIQIPQTCGKRYEEVSLLVTALYRHACAVLTLLFRVMMMDTEACLLGPEILLHHILS